MQASGAAGQVCTCAVCAGLLWSHPGLSFRKLCLLEIPKQRVLAIAQQTARKTPKQQLREFGLASMSQAQKDIFVEEARQEAIVGSCARSWDYTVSGFRSYLKFAGQVLPLGASLLPPKLRILLAWQRTFRSHGTYCNYLGHVKTACLVRGVSTQVLCCGMSGHAVLSLCCAKVFSHTALLRAKSTVKKYGGFKPRERMWIRRCASASKVLRCFSYAVSAQAAAGENRRLVRPA